VEPGRKRRKTLLNWRLIEALNEKTSSRSILGGRRQTLRAQSLKTEQASKDMMQRKGDESQKPLTAAEIHDAGMVARAIWTSFVV